MRTTSDHVGIVQASRRLGLSEYLTRAYALSGALPGFRTPANRWRFRLADVDAFAPTVRAEADRPYLPGGVAEFERTDREQSPSEAREVTDGDCSRSVRREERSAANPKGEQS